MFDFSKVKRRRLDNGLLFLSDTEVDNDIVALKLHLHLGSLYEADAEAGLTSCFARMLLKGAGERNAAQLAMELESLGVRLHTGVGNDNGIVSLVCPREVFAQGLDIMLEVLTEPTFPEAELSRDIQTSIGKIRARLDHPFSHAMDLFEETYYEHHPYHKPAIGYEETVSRLTVAGLRGKMQQVMRTDNMVAALVGRVDAEPVIERLQQRLMPGTGSPQIPDPGGTVGQVAREKLEARQTQTSWIIAGWPAPPLGHPDSAPMALLASILGSTMDSRLFAELRERRSLAYEVGAQYRAYAGPSCMICYIGTGRDQYASGREGIVEQVERLRREGPTKAEVERTRSYMNGSHRLTMERNAHRASSYGVHELFGLSYDYAARFLAELEATTMDDMLRVADVWWRECTVAAVVPEGAVPEGTVDVSVT